MKFATITPIAGLEKYGTYLSNTHLVLAQLMYNRTYSDYYSIRRQAGDFIILDNGAYENTRPIDKDAYFNIIKNLNPQVAVLPDQLMSPWRITTSLSLRFLDEFAERLANSHYTQWMFVPQCERPADFLASLHTVLDDGRAGHHVSWIGLGRYLATKFDNPPEGDFNWRTRFAKEVKHFFPQMKLHALGMAAGDVEELKELKAAGVKSIDSSCAVWRGWNGYGLEDPDWKTFGTPCNFHAEAATSSADILIQENLEVIRAALAG